MIAGIPFWLGIVGILGMLMSSGTPFLLGFLVFFRKLIRIRTQFRFRFGVIFGNLMRIITHFFLSFLVIFVQIRVDIAFGILVGFRILYAFEIPFVLGIHQRWSFYCPLEFLWAVRPPNPPTDVRHETAQTEGGEHKQWHNRGTKCQACLSLLNLLHSLHSLRDDPLSLATEVRTQQGDSEDWRIRNLIMRSLSS